jgi:hypothetical protein
MPAQALCAWLEEQAAAGGRAAQALPVYYLLRGRIAEGLHANARLSREPPKDGAHLLLSKQQGMRCYGAGSTSPKACACSIGDWESETLLN